MLIGKKVFERFFRRNVVVHNHGIVDKKYRNKTGYKDKETVLEVSKYYLDETIRLFNTAANRLSNDLEIKFSK